MKFRLSDTTSEIAKIIYENMRNTVVCSSVAVAGIAVDRYKELSFLGESWAPTISWVLLICSALLVIFNLMVGYSQILEKLPPKNNFIQWGLYIPILITYITIVITVFGCVVKLQVNSIRNSNSPHVEQRVR